MKLRHSLPFSFAIAAVTLAADVPVAPTPQKVLEDYRQLVRVTNEPKPIAVGLAFLCRSSPERDLVIKETGPHAMRFVHYYLNEITRRQLRRGDDGDYPAGSVIVKEKMSRSVAADNVAPMPAEAVAGMIKGAPGSNPQTRDWEFFYFDRKYSYDKQGTAKPVSWIQASDVQHCAGCHSNAKDMVFGRFTEPYKIPVADKK